MLKCAVCWLSLKVTFCLFLIVFTYKITEYCVYRKPSEPLHWKIQVDLCWNVSHVMFACFFCVFFFYKAVPTSVIRTKGKKIISLMWVKFLPPVPTSNIPWYPYSWVNLRLVGEKLIWILHILPFLCQYFGISTCSQILLLQVFSLFA